VKGLVIAVALTLHPRVQKEPRLKYLDFRGNYRIENPLRRPVRVTLECGEDWAPVNVEVPAGVALEIQVKGPDAEEPNCFMAGWRRL
jgi:hypothetical protein